ncbi:MAG: PhzF family phenazine biosynthesis protein [Verrucomicrobiota bacterium]|nr:PhzF family phenazine biosynthesis protein [Verrucomicrobiota bacterium]
MKLPYFEVAAFARRPFAGNQAGVCLRENRLPDALMQAIAAENNLAETAFVLPQNGGYELRWFTPVAEIDLCGHATLASGHVLVKHCGLEDTTIRFHSPRSGELGVTRDGDRLVLDFPVRPVKRCEISDELVAALGAKPTELYAARDYFAVFSSAAEVRAIKPDFALLKNLPNEGVLITAPGDAGDCDFVSRFFVPKHGIDEDAVTGSTHCNLIPFWSERLGKTKMLARQTSARGGELYCELRGDRVGIGGNAVTFLAGEVEVPNET